MIEIETMNVGRQRADHRIEEVMDSLDAAKAELLALKEARIAAKREAAMPESARTEIRELAEAGQNANQTNARLKIERDIFIRRPA